MIDINLLRKDPERIKKDIAKKKAPEKLIDSFLDVDERWRKKTAALDDLRAERKSLGREAIERAKEVKEQIKKFEEELRVLEEERSVILEQIPNPPASDVPVGDDESGNKVLYEVGEKPKIKSPKDYLALTEGLIDTERAAKVSGGRFGYILGDLVMLEFALVKFALDSLRPHGFMPIVPPVMAKSRVMRGMGKGKFIDGGDAFHLPQDDLYLVGSSEHTIGPFHMDEIFDEADLPRRYVGFSTCFRREAGSYGKDVKGILRVHQFDKIEMFSFSLPEKSEEEHAFLLARIEEMMKALKLPYRVLAICTGDMGFGDYKQYDVDTWLPGQGKYRETQSCSNVGDFQSRGINIKFRRAPGGKAEGYVHTLNSTAFAIGRMIIAIVENNQQADGSIIVPEVLRAYVGKPEIKAKED